MENTIEYLPQTIRVWLPHKERPGLYVLIVPNPREAPGVREFFLGDNNTGCLVFMFGCCPESDADAIILAQVNAWGHIDELERVERAWEKN